MTDQPGLFETPADDPTDDMTPPTCPLCRLRPVAWGPVKQDWTRYCGGSSCPNSHRKCLHCGQVFPLGEFRYVKYCSTECSVDAQYARAQYKGKFHHCARCGHTSQSHYTQPHGWRDGRCSNCWKTCVGADRVKTMANHNVPFEMADRWAQSGWLCDLCGQPVSIQRGAIDHDHQCCPGGRSCGKCIRGYLHNNCNIAIGNLHDDPALLRAAADYLDRYNNTR